VQPPESAEETNETAAAVTADSAPIEAELWTEIRSAVTMTALLLITLLGTTYVIGSR